MPEAPGRIHRALGIGGGVVFLGLAALFVAQPYPTAIDATFESFTNGINPEAGLRWGDSAGEVLADFIVWALVDSALVLTAWRYGGPSMGGTLAVAILGHEIVVRSLKAVIARPRPEGAFSESGAFPSGHVANATLTFLLALFVVLPLLRQRGVLSTSSRLDGAMVALVTATYTLYRAFTGEHWLTDVLGGMALGLAWSFVTVLALRAMARAPGP